MGHDGEDLIQPKAETLTYDRYLKIADLLSLQQELSEPKEHDETLFIIIHQVYELWFKQILHELSRAQTHLQQHALIPVLRSLKRVDAIQKVLVHQIDILETMAPDEFNRFRERLNPASGFQSHQFRLLEFRLGLKDERYLKFFQHAPEIRGKLQDALQQRSLYDDFLHHLAHRGLAVPQAVLGQPTTKTHEISAELTQIIADLYRRQQEHYDLYMACEALMDLDEQLMLWRSRHVMMVQRMIGDLKGTGGSSGAQYLQQTLNKRAFPELWLARDQMGCDSQSPAPSAKGDHGDR